MRQPPLSTADHDRVQLGIYAMRDATTLHVRITTNLNHVNVEPLRKRVRDEIETAGVTSVVIDLRHCARMDRRGLEGLAQIAGDTRRVGGSITLAHLSTELRLWIELKGATKLFTISESPNAQPEVAP